MDSPFGSVGKRAALLFISGFIGMVFFAYGYGVYGYRLLEKYPPDWSSFGSIKAVGLLIATMLAYLAIRPEKQLERPMYWSALPPCSLAIGVIIPLASAEAVLLWPQQISGYVREQEFLSILTEFVLLGALVYIGLSAFAARSSRSFCPSAASDTDRICAAR